MKITVLSSKVIKPAYAVAPPTTGGEVVPLTVLDKVNFDQHISGIYFFRPPAPRGADLEAGFAKALAVYREWAGRLTQGHRTVLLNDAGARFVEAVADVTLGSVMPLEPTPEVLSLHPSAGNGDDGEVELMLVQATRFACNSLVVGFTAHHLVADGRAMFNFLVAWGQATRGVAVDPVPVHDRVSFFKPREPLSVQFEHRGAEFMHIHDKEKKKAAISSSGGSPAGDVIAVARVHFTREMILRLKSQASSSPQRRAYNTLQCVVAHLWRCITKARGLAGGGTTTGLRITVDGRARMRHPPVPSGYAGNVVLWARPAAVAKDLVGRPLGHAAELVSRAVAGIDDGYFRSFIDFASSGAVEKEGLVPAADGTKRVRCPDVEVFSLIGLPSGDLDFGAGRPELYMPSYLPEEGLVFVVPCFSGDGSIHAQVSLFSHAMEIFRDCCYSLEPAGARL